jgi:hypothetical protein
LTFESTAIPVTHFFFYWFKLSLSGLVFDNSGSSLVSGVGSIQKSRIAQQL